ncbi:hypothetical protein VAA_02875 [Vibrio anguillarum 775]|nr:hypothetical protein VAA_02875 [Vibrio anguillarum 775]
MQQASARMVSNVHRVKKLSELNIVIDDKRTINELRYF